MMTDLMRRTSLINLMTWWPAWWHNDLINMMTCWPDDLITWPTWWLDDQHRHVHEHHHEHEAEAEHDQDHEHQVSLTTFSLPSLLPYGHLCRHDSWSTFEIFFPPAWTPASSYGKERRMEKEKQVARRLISNQTKNRSVTITIMTKYSE